MEARLEIVAQERMRKVQEKNKRAQARYRAKQKEKMQTYEEQCKHLELELKALKEAYGNLEDEKAALEDTVRELRGRQQGLPGGPEAERTAEASPRSAALPPLEAAQQSHEGPQGWDRLPGGEETFWQTIVRAIIVKTLGEEQARQADTMPFQWKPATDIFSIYKGLIEELAVRLATADKEKTREAYKPVEEVIHAMRTMGRTYEEGLSHQQRVEGGARLREEINSAHGPPKPDIWRHVLNACRVSASQREKILVLRSAFLAQMETIIKQRKEIVWTLQQATVMPDTASKRESAFVQAVQSSKELQESLASEHLAKEEYLRAVCHTTLNEVQEARMLITAFPYLVDVAAVTDLLALEPFQSSSEEEEADEEPFRSHTLPAILQIPAVIDSDLTPDLYCNAFYYGCNQHQLVASRDGRHRGAHN